MAFWPASLVNSEKTAISKIEFFAQRASVPDTDRLKISGQEVTAISVRDISQTRTDVNLYTFGPNGPGIPYTNIEEL